MVLVTSKHGMLLLQIRVLVQMENLDLSNFDTIKLVAVTFLLLNSSIRKRPILEWICIEQLFNKNSQQCNLCKFGIWSKAQKRTRTKTFEITSDS